MRPTFNVTDFQGVINVQMNDAMRNLLVSFINDVDDPNLEIEIKALRNALIDPKGQLHKKQSRPFRRYEEPQELSQ